MVACEYDAFILYNVYFPKGSGNRSWWRNWPGMRERNVGWRIDAVWVTRELMPHVKEAFILKDVTGSDHCPVGITLAV